MSERVEPLAVRILVLSTIADTGSRRLPPERDRGASFDMSHGARREQLSRIENLGMVLPKSTLTSASDAA